MAPFDEAATRLLSIPGIGKRLAEVVEAEIGTDMGRFPTAGHLASWAGLCPGNHESGRRIELTSEDVHRAMRGVTPEAPREHVVNIGGDTYPVKQVVAAAAGLGRLDFTSAQARSILRRLGFTVQRVSH